MATTLEGWTWVGDDEPTTGVLATQEWIVPTTGNIYRRDTSNTTWIYAGNVNNRMGGAVETAGSTVTGPLLDVPNLAPYTDPDFTGTIRQEGDPVALLRQIAELEKRMYDRIIAQVRENYLSQLRSSIIRSNMAFKIENISTTIAVLKGSGYTLTLPYYSDGIQATVDELVGYGIASDGGVVWDFGTEGGRNFYLYKSGTDSLVIKAAWNPPGYEGIDTTFAMYFLVVMIAVR